MSQNLDNLKDAVSKWYTRRKQNLEAEAEFLELVAQTGDDIRLAEGLSAETFSEIIADSIGELTS